MNYFFVLKEDSTAFFLLHYLLLCQRSALLSHQLPACCAYLFNELIQAAIFLASSFGTCGIGGISVA
jgi:hypothetical protein